MLLNNNLSGTIFERQKRSIQLLNGFEVFKLLHKSVSPRVKSELFTKNQMVDCTLN